MRVKASTSRCKLRTSSICSESLIRAWSSAETFFSPEFDHGHAKAEDAQRKRTVANNATLDPVSRFAPSRMTPLHIFSFSIIFHPPRQKGSRAGSRSGAVSSPASPRWRGGRRRVLPDSGPRSIRSSPCRFPPCAQASRKRFRFRRCRPSTGFRCAG